jgi:hypothetical protein
MKLAVTVSLLLFLLCGCTSQVPISAAQPTETPAAAQVITAQPASILPAADVPLPTVVEPRPQPSSLPEETPVLSPGGWAQTDGTLTVELLSEPEVTVHTAEYTVEGRAPQGAVVSVNEDILLVGTNQFFSSLVMLDEGPNLIEVAASDIDSQEVDFELIVVYEE